MRQGSLRKREPCDVSLHSFGGFHADQVQRGGDGLAGGAGQLELGGAGVADRFAFKLIETLISKERADLVKGAVLCAE